ncbi:MAG: carbohydrate ABC transporter permease [Rhodospirillaceae bacterium]|nr:carbohydrate ABC transporter permease [Rhodospirillaceae bacterium]
MPYRIRRRIGRALFALLLAAILGYTVFPFYWAIVTSLKTGSALFEPRLWPREPGLGNYLAVFREQPFARNIANSAIVAGTVTLLSLFLGITAAFALGRIRFAGRRPTMLVILAVSMFPQIALLSGLFQLIRWLGLYNSLWALILAYLIFTLPFTVWILTAFIRELPRELEEAAIVDGAGPWQTLTRVMLPLMAPAMAAAGLLAFIAAWNEFLFALTFTLTNDQRTVPVAIALISGSSAFELPWGNIMAASVVVTLPLIVLVLAFQRRIVAGLTAGAVKG